MHILRLRRTLSRNFCRTTSHSRSSWAGYREYICARGLREVCNVPEEAQVIFACTTADRPQHDHWFKLHAKPYQKTIDWSDDRRPQALDPEFNKWLGEQYQEGDRYLTIMYEEI